MADETWLQITVCHLPPGTSKWNKIEHRLFSYISQNWRGKPLIDCGDVSPVERVDEMANATFVLFGRYGSPPLVFPHLRWISALQALAHLLQV